MSERFHPSTHPPLPPTTEDDRVSWLRLLRSRRVGPSTFYRLMHQHGNAAAALDALPEVAKAAGVKTYTPCPAEVALAEMRQAQQLGASMLCVGMGEYPAAVLDISDPPPILWAQGDISLLRRNQIALVGARNASSLGTRMAKALATDLSKAGYVIVSGLARGIDTAAHLASLDAGTIAVMAGGVDVIYPSENMHLGERIGREGLLISEQPMGAAPQARHFPRRNRLISALSQAVVVVEAAAKSGSLITARDALDQGREVLAVPGHPFDARSGGSNILIRDGATLVRNADDVIEALSPIVPTDNCPEQVEFDIPAAPDHRPKRTLQETAALHRQILDKLGPNPLAEDQLIRDLGTSARQMAPALTELELTGAVTRHPGGLLSRSA